VVATAAVLATAAGPAAPASGTIRTAQTEPSPKACIHNNPSLAQLTPEQMAQTPWPQQMLEYTQAWAFARGAGVSVAVVDSGVDASHEQLVGHVRTGWDVTSGSVRPGGTTDCFGHGTAVAGIIAAQAVSGRAMTGIAPDATIIPVRETWGIDSNGQPVTAPVDDLLSAMRTAVDSGASIVNVSITVPDVQLRQDQRDAFNALAQYASDRNVLIVAASGNKDQYPELSNQQFATYPAKLAVWFRNVIAVSGVTSDGKLDSNAVVGSFITVAAPDRGFPSTKEHGGLLAVSGTSYAAPMVSGLAALLRSRFPQASAADLRARIEATADHPSTDLPDPGVGYGVINPLAAVTAVMPPSATPVVIPASAGPLSTLTDGDATLKAVALGVGAVAVLLAGILAFTADVARRGRRRGWKPGLRPPAAGAAGTRRSR
jgi:type VII secretion-associated serine protease mycosin